MNALRFPVTRITIYRYTCNMRRINYIISLYCLVVLLTLIAHCNQHITNGTEVAIRHIVDHIHLNIYIKHGYIM